MDEDPFHEAGPNAMRVLEGQRVPIKVWASLLEEQAEAQLRNVAGLPFVYHHVAAMADAHWGMGATVGSVIATQNAICPAAVGVDIGCGMVAQKTTLTVEELDSRGLAKLRHSIERSVPVGFNQHKTVADPSLDWFRAHEPPTERMASDKSKRQLGTLGGGNHFIEVCTDEQGFAWVMLHSGSRNIGKVTAERHVNEAKKLCASLFVDLADPDLAFLPRNSGAFTEYMRDLQWCQDYAMANRQVMLASVLKNLSHFAGLGGAADSLDGEAINCHHNYVAWERHFGSDVMVTRKGAIRARAGDMGIIPGSMGTESFNVRGRGNPESFDSAPHGAGRRMSRGEARRTFTKADIARQTEGVECRKDLGIVDELPGAYKDISTVMDDSSDLVEIVARLKQVLCVKG